MFKIYILSRRERKKIRKTQKPTLEFIISSILLKIYIIKIALFAQLIKNLKINLFIIIIIDIEKVLREKSYSNSTIFLFKEY